MTASGRALLIVVMVTAGLAGFVAFRLVAEAPPSTALPAALPQAAEARAATPATVAVPVPGPAAPIPQTAAAPAATPSAPAPAAGGVAQAAPRQATPAQAAPAAAAAAAPAAAPAAPEPPRFDVVRIGARGGAVIAGRAAAGAEVLLLEDGREVARARADARGEWVILPADPLAPGTRRFTLLARLSGDAIMGPDTVVVVVPEPATAVAEAPRTAQPEAPQAAETRAAARPEPAAPRTAIASAIPAEAARPAEPAPRRPAIAAAPPATAAPAAAEPETAAASPAAEQAPARPAPPAPEPRRALAAASPQTPAPHETPAQEAPPRQADASRPEEPSRRPEAQPAQPLVVLLPGSQPVARVLQGSAQQQGLALGQVDYDEAGAIRFAGTAAPGATIRLYVNDRHTGDARADDQGRWTLAPGEAIAIGRHRLRVDQIAAAGAVGARIEVPFQRDRLPDAEVAHGRVVVQPGHSLWRLARSVYGQGVRYSVIYEANREQIRNPHRIFPGQVFDMPGMTADGSPAAPAESSRSR